jgi:hypothetical protein
MNFGNFTAALSLFLLSRSASGLTCPMQSSNLISDDGAKSIAAAIKDNSSLQELELVRLFVQIFVFDELALFFLFFAAACRADMCCAELQRNRRRRCSIHCRSLER